jgi:MurNAc alpha-1-phosphate uridylyltransferase
MCRPRLQRFKHVFWRNSMQPKAAMIFAAGFGKRMAPLTDGTPKPMLKVLNTPLIDHAFALLRSTSIKKFVVNTHYLAQQVEDHVSSIEGAVYLREVPDLLETGGGLKNALPLLGAGPVVTVNSDLIFTEGSPLPALMAVWNPEKMDALLALVPIENTIAHNGAGDFFCDPEGRLSRKGAQVSAPFVYTGVQIVKTDGLAKISDRVFSLNKLWDQMIATRRAYGMIYPGQWVDIGTPTGFAAAEQVLLRDV